MPSEYAYENELKVENLTQEIIEKITKEMAKFHKETSSKDEQKNFGSVEILSKNWEDLFLKVEDFKNLTISINHFYFIRQKILKFMKLHKDVFEKRMNEGKIKPLFIDNAIIVDVALDVASVFCSLQFLGKQDFANLFIQKYLENNPDESLNDVLDFYKSWRCFLRGYQLSNEQKKDDAQKYFKMSRDFADKLKN